MNTKELFAKRRELSRQIAAHEAACTELEAQVRAIDATLADRSAMPYRQARLNVLFYQTREHGTQCPCFDCRELRSM